MTIEAEWFAENRPQPVLLPASVSALDIARWYAHELANFLLAPSYCDSLRTYLPVWRLPLQERWCFVPHSIEDSAMQCYRSAVREALERGRGSTGGHEIAQVLEEWAAAQAFEHPELDGMRASVLLDRTLELRRLDTIDGSPDTAARDQYRVIDGKPHHRRMPPEACGSACWSKEPDWVPLRWDASGVDLINAFLRHEGARPT